MTVLEIILHSAKSLMRAISVDWLTGGETSFMAFNSIPSWNSEVKEVMKVFRVSCSEYLPSLSPVSKETTRYVRKKELSKNEKLLAGIWEMITSILYTLRKGTGQIISARYSHSTLTSQ